MVGGSIVSRLVALSFETENRFNWKNESSNQHLVTWQHSGTTNASMVHDHLRWLLMGVNCWKDFQQCCMESGLVCHFHCFSSSLNRMICISVFFYVNFHVCRPCYHTVVGVCWGDLHDQFAHPNQIPFPFPTPWDQEVLVPFWEKSVGAPSPTWCFAISTWPYLVTTLVSWSWWTRLCVHIIWAIWLLRLHGLKPHDSMALENCLHESNTTLRYQ